MRRRSHAIRWTPEQLEQYRLLEHKLQRAHATAAQALIKLTRLHPTHLQYEPTCNDLVDVVHSISLLNACCEAIKASGFRPKFTVINLVFVNPCDFCLANPKSRQPDDENSLEPDSGWGVQVETLLRLTTLTTLHNVKQRCCSPLRLKKSSRSLADLNKALLREQRYLRSLERWPVPEIDVIIDDKESCDVCGHPFVHTLLEGTGDALDVRSPQRLEGL
jgi:hypothetical protein